MKEMTSEEREQKINEHIENIVNLTKTLKEAIGDRELQLVKLEKRVRTMEHTIARVLEQKGDGKVGKDSKSTRDMQG